MITQRLSEASFPPKGSSKSSAAVSCFCAFRYISTQLATRVFTYFILFPCTLFSFVPPNLLIYLGFLFILQALVTQQKTQQ